MAGHAGRTQRNSVGLYQGFAQSVLYDNGVPRASSQLPVPGNVVEDLWPCTAGRHPDVSQRNTSCGQHRYPLFPVDSSASHETGALAGRLLTTRPLQSITVASPGF